MSSSESGHPSAPAGCHSWWRSWQASRLAIRQSETQRNRSNVVFSNHRLCDFSYSRSLSSHIPKPETGVPHKAWGRRSHNRHCLSCSFGAEGPGRLEPDEQWLSNQMIIKWAQEWWCDVQPSFLHPGLEHHAPPQPHSWPDQTIVVSKVCQL